MTTTNTIATWNANADGTYNLPQCGGCFEIEFANIAGEETVIVTVYDTPEVKAATFGFGDVEVPLRMSAQKAHDELMARGLTHDEAKALCATIEGMFDVRDCAWDGENIDEPTIDEAAEEREWEGDPENIMTSNDGFTVEHVNGNDYFVSKHGGTFRAWFVAGFGADVAAKANETIRQVEDGTFGDGAEKGGW